MASSSGFIPFQGAVDKIQNSADDDFEPSFDECYGDPDCDDGGDGISGMTLIWLTTGFLALLVVLRYGCVWFIDTFVLCEFTRNRGNQSLLKRCCPYFFPRRLPDASDTTDVRPSNNSNVIDDVTATNTSRHSTNSDSDSSSDDDSEDGGVELTERNCIYTKRLLRILTEKQKQSIFASLLRNRIATTADISEGGEESIKQKKDNNSDSSEKTSNSVESISIPDGSSSNEDTACCPICIQNINVGDSIYQCKKCHKVFKWDCILEWVETGSTLCPYCRREIYTRAMLEEAYLKERKELPKKQRGV